MTSPDRAVACTPTPGLGAIRVGVFDSGLGGLSVLRALHQTLPQAELLYVADSGHAPYGEKGEPYVVARSLAIADFLLAQGAAALVVACNTATAAAVHALRSAYPHLPIVGIEPGVKPAVARSRHGRIGVLATEGTLNSDKFKSLLLHHGQGATIISQACPGLAGAIEQGDLHAPEVTTRIQAYCARLREAQVDTVVLGCTHYPLVADQIAQFMGPEVHLIDTSDAVARQAARLINDLPISPDGKSGQIRLWSSGSAARLQQLAQGWLGITADSKPLPGA